MQISNLHEYIDGLLQYRSVQQQFKIIKCDEDKSI